MRSTEKLKRGATALAMVIFATTLAACGGGSDSEGDSGTRQAGGPGPRGALTGLSSDDIQCLSDHGVTLPARPDGATGAPGARPEGARPEGEGRAGATGPRGARRDDGPRERFDSEEMQAAMEDCNIEIPEPEGDQVPPAGIPNTPDPGTSSSAAATAMKVS